MTTSGTFHALQGRLGWFSDVIVSAVPHVAATPRVLDIGCGTGDQIFDLAGRLPSARFVGVDIDQENIAVAERRRGQSPDAPRIAFHAADYRVFASEDPFDVVISYSALQFVPGGAQALARRVAHDVAPGGIFVNAMPCRCRYNAALGGARWLLRQARSPLTDRMLLTVARLLHGGTMDAALLSERVVYAYETPLQCEDDLAAAAECLGLRTIHRQPVAHASPAQLKHALRIMRRTGE